MDFTDADLDSMSDEELDLLERQESSRLANARERARQGAMYRQVRKAEESKALGLGVKDVVGTAERQKAVAAMPPVSPLVGALNQDMAPRSVAEASDLDRRTLDSGARATTPPGRAISTDIEGALRDGGREIIAGDQRLIVSNDQLANPLATRDEMPPMTDMVAAYLGLDDTPKENRPSLVGTLFGNVLQAPSRVMATAKNLAHEAENNPETFSVSEVPGALMRALNNESDTASGGMVAAREGGWGDVIRNRSDTVLDGNPDAEVRDVLTDRGLAGGSLLSYPFRRAAQAVERALPESAARVVGPASESALAIGDVMTGNPFAIDTLVGANLKLAAPLAREGLSALFSLTSDQPMDQIRNDVFGGMDVNAPLSNMSDEAAGGFGTAISLVADPINAIPVGDAAKAAGLAVREALPMGARQVVDKVGRVLSTNIPTPSFLRSPGQRVEAGMAEAFGADDASFAGGVVDSATRQAAAERNIFNQKVAAQLDDALSPLSYDEAKNAMRVAEGDGIEALAAKPIEDRIITLVDSFKKNGGQTLASQDLADLNALASRNGLTASLFDRVERNSYRLARELGVLDDMFLPHPAEATAPKTVRAAKRIRSVFEEYREQFQGAGKLKGVTSAEKYMPRVEQSKLVTALADINPRVADFVERNFEGLFQSPSFNPLKPRAMDDVVDAGRLRIQAIQELKGPQPVVPKAPSQMELDEMLPSASDESATAAARLNAKPRASAPPEEPSFSGVGEEASASASAPSSVKASSPEGARVDIPANLAEDSTARERIRSALANPPKRIEPGLSNTPETLDARGSDRRFSHSPARVIGAYANAANPEIARARLGDLLTDVKLPSGRPLVSSVGDFVGNNKRLTELFDGDLTAAWESKNGVAYLNGEVIKELKASGYDFIHAADPLAEAIPKLKNKVVPQAMAKEMRSVVERLRPGSVEKFLANFVGGPVNRLWVPIVLNTPGFHVRNAVFGGFQAFLAIGADAFNPELFRQAQSVAMAAAGEAVDDTMKVGGKTWRTADLVDLVESQGIYEGGRAADLRRSLGSTLTYRDDVADLGMFNAAKEKALALNPWSSRTLGERGTAFETLASRVPAGAMAGRASTAATLDNVQRIQVFLGNLKAGKTPGQAANETIKYMFDYTGAGLTSFERSVRQLVPFYTWVRYSSAQMISEALSQPGKYTAVNKIYDIIDRIGSDQNYDPREIPGYIRDTGMVASPFRDDTEDAATFVGYERPGTQLGSLSSAAEQLGPLARMLIESRTGRFLHGGMETDPAYDEEKAWEGPLDAVGDPLNISGELVPGYLASVVGGIPGFAAQLALTHLAPEYAAVDRRTGQEAAQRVIDRSVSMMGGPRTTTIRPAAVRVATQKTAKDALKKSDQRAGRRQRGALSPDPVADLLYGLEDK